jgi:hypothetical protein
MLKKITIVLTLFSVLAIGLTSCHSSGSSIQYTPEEAGDSTVRNEFLQSNCGDEK